MRGDAVGAGSEQQAGEEVANDHGPVILPMPGEGDDQTEGGGALNDG